MLFVKNNHIKSFSIFISVILFSAGLIQLQKKQLSQLLTTQDKTNHFEKEKQLKASVKFQQKIPAFGFDNLIADWNFLQFLQYFGDIEAREITGYSAVTDYFKTSVKRDPNFVQSHLTMSSANSLFAVEPEQTVQLLNKAIETVEPKNPYSYYPFFLLTYKATDEILFLGDLETAHNSYKMAANWAKLRQDDLGEKLSQRYKETSRFLATNPDPTKAQFGAWMSVLSGSGDSKTQQHVLKKLNELGAEINISPDGKINVKPPKFEDT